MSFSRNGQFRRGMSWRGRLLILVLVLAVVSVLAQIFCPKDKFFWIARVNGRWVSGMDKAEAQESLEQTYRAQKVYVKDITGARIATFALTDAEISAEKAVERAMDYPFWQRVLPFSAVVRLFVGGDAAPEVKLDTSNLEKYVPSEPVNAKLRFSGADFVIEKERAGYSYDERALKEQLGKLKLRADRETSFNLVAALVAAELTEAKIEPQLAGVKAAIDGGVEFGFGGETYAVPQQEMAEMVSFRAEDGAAVATVDDFALRQYFADNFEERIMVAAGYFMVDKYGLTISRGKDDDKSVDYEELTAGLERILAGGEKGKVEVVLTPYSYQYVGRTEYGNNLAGLQKELMERFSGESFAVAVVDLTGKNAELAELGGKFGIREDKVWTAASTYKIFVAYSILQAVERGEVKWSDTTVMGNSLERCFEVMIVESNNECARWWLDKKGFEEVAKEGQALGAERTSFRYGDMRTSAADLALMLGKLYDGSFANKENTEKLLGLMKRQTHRSGIPAGINDGVVADKVGWLDGLLHDAGIVYGENGDYILVVMTDDSTWKGIAAAATAVERRMK